MAQCLPFAVATVAIVRIVAFEKEGSTLVYGEAIDLVVVVVEVG